jgi:hypothetical protein
VRRVLLRIVQFTSFFYFCSFLLLLEARQALSLSEPSDTRGCGAIAPPPDYRRAEALEIRDRASGAIVASQAQGVFFFLKLAIGARAAQCEELQENDLNRGHAGLPARDPICR